MKVCWSTYLWSTTSEECWVSFAFSFILDFCVILLLAWGLNIGEVNINKNLQDFSILQGGLILYTLQKLSVVWSHILLEFWVKLSLEFPKCLWSLKVVYVILFCRESTSACIVQHTSLILLDLLVWYWLIYLVFMFSGYVYF